MTTISTAERDATNARAKAWQRPLSSVQIAALHDVAKQPLARGRAGWGAALEPVGCWLPVRYWQGQTILALEQRGLCRIVHARRFAKITPKGLRELEERGR